MPASEHGTTSQLFVTRRGEQAARNGHETNARSALLPQMKRDYQAMHLRDSLDPKRFMKGKTKSTVPEQFAVSPGLSAVSKRDILHVIGS